MDELKLTGNHLKGSRPVLSFDGAFDQEPHLQLLKEMFTQVGGTVAAVPAYVPRTPARTNPRLLRAHGLRSLSKHPRPDLCHAAAPPQVQAVL